MHIYICIERERETERERDRYREIYSYIGCYTLLSMYSTYMYLCIYTHIFVNHGARDARL